MHPKIAAVLGAHTELGKLVTRELLRSPLIDKVYALAAVDPRDDISIRPQDYHKFALHLDSLDFVEETVSRYIPQCDIAFCALGGGKHDMAALGAYKFHKTNLDIPRRFIHEMVNLGVERVAVLSDPAASSRKRGSEFARVKHELEKAVRELQMEAAEHAPGVTMFRVPLMLTNLKDATGVHGTSINKRNKITQKAALKHEAGPSHAVHVRDVAKAMVADAFCKLQMVEASRNIEPAFRRRDIQYAVLEGEIIVNIAHERRVAQREYYAKRRQHQAYDHRVSDYARQHTNRTNLTQSSVPYDSAPSGTSPKRSHTSSERQEAHKNDSNESYMSGSPGEESEGYTNRNVEAENGAYQQESPSMSHGENDGPHSRSQSSKSQRFMDNEGIDYAGSGTYQDLDSHRRPDAYVTSVEALGHQLGYRLTDIRNNEFLPDVDFQEAESPENQNRFYQSRAQISHHPVQSGSHGLEEHLHGVVESPVYHPENNSRVRDHRYGSRTASFHSPPPRSLSFEMLYDLQARPPYDKNYRMDSPSRRNSIGSPRRSQSYHSGHAGYSDHAGYDAGRHADFPAQDRINRGESGYRRISRSERDGSRSSSLMARVAALAERVLAATDRPSMKRKDRFSERDSRHRQNERDIWDEENLERRENGDMRAMGETTI